MTLQHRHFAASQATRSGSFLLWIGKWFVVPVLRLACRLVPPLGRVLSATTGGLQGRVFRNRDRGDHRAAFAAALEGMERQHRSPHDGTWSSDIREHHWWSFLDLAAREAELLGDDDRVHVERLVEAARSPGGMQAAWCLRRIATWRWKTDETEAALTYAKRAVLADPSWPHGHIFVGWLGLVSGRFDPLPHLREALRVDSTCAESILETPEFAQAHGLLQSLGLVNSRST